MTELRERSRLADNQQVEKAEGDWNVRNQRDIVNFRIRERLVQRNTDVEVVYTKDNLPNVKNINDLPTPSLTRFLSNLIKTSNGYLHRLSIYRDTYLHKYDVPLREEVIRKLPVALFEDPEDLARAVASHMEKKSVLIVDVDARSQTITLKYGNLDSKLTTKAKFMEKVKEKIEEEVEEEVGEGKAKKKEKRIVVREVEVEKPFEVEDLSPVVEMNFFRAR